MSAGEDQAGAMMTRALEMLSREAARMIPGGWSPPSAPAGVLSAREDLQRQIGALVDSVLNRAMMTRGTANPGTEMIPMLSAPAPVRPGDCAEIPMTVTNEEPVERVVTLFGTNLASDSGHEIPALRLSIAPRQATLSPSGSAAFLVRIAVPPQSAPGHYAGLLQAAGAKYVKAVIALEVL